MHIISLTNTDAETTENTYSLDTFSPIIGFILYNCLFDKHFIPVQQQGDKVTPLTLYGNLTYIPNIGIVAINEIKHNNPLVCLGTSVGSMAYYQMKTHIEPKRVASNVLKTSDYPDNIRNLNVLSTNNSYC
ncbi:hypothetical protein TNCT_455471 [Trichonephila clavata]|uniref:Uncharacterized protein n=1 Tax=Trichonephila clavata TaxID=2740835 RepID=A0A8X6JEL7_TRICU|nr:hypothetical protein TNCT_455471 [Trichonephila clavata]